MEPRRALVAGCKSGAPVHLSFSAGQYDHLSRLRLWRQRFVEQKVPGLTYRLVSGAKTELDGGAHADPRRGVAARAQTLRSCCIPQRMRKDEFRDAHSARAFQGLEGDDGWGRHRLDANP